MTVFSRQHNSCREPQSSLSGKVAESALDTVFTDRVSRERDLSVIQAGFPAHVLVNNHVL